MEQGTVRWTVGAIGVLFLLLIGFAGLLFEYGGLRYFLRAKTYIKNLPAEDIQAISDNFYGTQPNLYNGILAGAWNDKVWVWGEAGLKGFGVEENTAFHYSDGCTQEILYPSDTSKGFSIQQQTLDFSSWKATAKAGDYVTVFVAQENSGFAVGNLQEIFGSNWWQFMQKDMQTACAK
jgi:hypothetical protein